MIKDYYVVFKIILIVKFGNLAQIFQIFSDFQQINSKILAKIRKVLIKIKFLEHLIDFFIFNKVKKEAQKQAAKLETIKGGY